MLLKSNAAFALDGEARGEPLVPAASVEPAGARPLVQKDLCYLLSGSVPPGPHEIEINVTAPDPYYGALTHVIHF